jgi:hypothetical protein
MGLFVCDKCGCVENTALGFWWSRDMAKRDNWFKGILDDYNGEALCSECCPTHFGDGSKTDKGIWHNRFPKEKWDGEIKVENR